MSDIRRKVWDLQHEITAMANNQHTVQLWWLKKRLQTILDDTAPKPKAGPAPGLPFSETSCYECGGPVKEYKPEYCCNGADCGCLGLPREPPLCEECRRLFFAPTTPPHTEYPSDKPQIPGREQ
jgi:hypothetical protein